MPPFVTIRFAKISLTASMLIGTTLLSQTSSSPAPLTKSQIYNQLDPQMANVILLYNEINGKPIVKLSPQDARQQFSPQDTAKIIARATGLADAPLPVGKV